MSARSIAFVIAALLVVSAPAYGMKSKNANSVEVTGTVTNVCVGKSTGVTMTITPGEDSKTFRAVGRYDSKNLFGKFDVPGRIIRQGSDFSCLQFEGNIEFGGNDGSYLPAGTKSSYVMTIYFTKEGGEGVYRVGHIDGFDFEQYGTMNLSAHHEIPGVTQKTVDVPAMRTSSVATAKHL